jgi:hypothetical protein
MTNNATKYSCAFIIPHSDKYENQCGKRFIAHTIEGLFSQTDDDWCSIIVVDVSPSKEVKDYLSSIKEKYYPKIDIIFLGYDVGPGVSRNLGILKAMERGCYIILFNDSNDISHPRRIEVTKNMFSENSNRCDIFNFGSNR